VLDVCINTWTRGSFSMSEARVKTHKWWLFCRIYAPLGMAAWLIFPAVLSSGGANWLLYPLFAFPLAVIAFLMLHTLNAFRFDYGCFGRYKRTPWPEEDPILVKETPGGSVGLIIGSATLGVWMWVLWHAGLGMHIPYCGKAFIPLDAIQEVRRPSGGLRATLIHNSPEVRSRISIPSKAIVKGIEGLLEERRIQGGPSG
jgi:hypothetical protein